MSLHVTFALPWKHRKPVYTETGHCHSQDLLLLTHNGKTEASREVFFTIPKLFFCFCTLNCWFISVNDPLKASDGFASSESLTGFPDF